METIRSENDLLAAALEQGRPTPAGDGLVIGFPASAAFFKRQAEKDERRAALTQAIRAVTGQRVTVTFELRDDVVPEDRTMSARGARRAVQGRVRRGRDLRGRGSLMPQQPNMNQMLKQVQKMQADMMAAQEKLKDEEVQGSAGGGAVKVTITGDLVIKQVYIDPSAIDPEDPELLSDMVTAAVNEAIRAAQELASSKLGSVTGGLGGLGLPGM